MVTIDWGDGSPPTMLNLDAGALSFTAPAHQYLDNLPGDAPYAITVTLTDDDGGTATASAATTVHNVAPTISAVTSSSPGVGGARQCQAVTVSATFADMGALDTHTAIINWGDGTTTAAVISESGGSGTAAGSHAYANGGIYSVVVTLKDDNNGTATAVTSAVIAGVGVHDGTLQIIGTNAHDHVTVSKLCHDWLLVHASFLPGCGLRMFNAEDIDEIAILLGGGDDHASIANNVRTTAILDGGAGDDKLDGSGAASILLGGDGDDMLNAGSGYNILIGGAGSDRLVGRGSGDILIAGATTLDIEDAALSAGFDHALLAVLAEWSSTAPYQTRVDKVRTLFSAFDDDAKDTLTGLSGRDWFFANLHGGVQDRITDLSRNEVVDEID
jgi:Ca2+-binding RTX toxin-like protein